MPEIARTIRLAVSSDAEAIATIYAPVVEMTAISFEDIAPTAAEMGGRIASITHTFPWLVLEEHGDVLGYAYASRHRERPAYRWAVDTSVYVRDSARGRGVGRALYEALFRVLQAQRFRRAVAGIALPNDASVALHRSVGFTAVGVYREIGYKHGAWRDVSWWERALGPSAVPPDDPIPLSQIAAASIAEVLSG